MIREMHDKGMKITQIAKELGISRPTVRKYLKSKKPPEYNKKRRKSLLEDFKPYIRERIDEYNLSAVRILEEIKKKGYKGGYSTLKNYCRTLRKDRAVKAVYRYETEPGRQAQVDFGEFGHIEIDGRRKKLYAFSYILGYSRYRYVEFTTDISTENVIKMHMNAFRYTHGIPSEILFDNMKQVVLERRIKASESKFNSLFQQFSDYYGFNIRLCFPYRPQTKGKIERNIGYLRGNFFNGRKFESLSDINAQCDRWFTVANGKVNATTGKIPVEALKDETLVSVSSVPEFRYSISKSRTVSRECYVHYNSNRYSVPWKYAGRNCTVNEENGKIRISIDGEIIEHDLIPGTGQISKKKEHFEGLLKTIRDQNVKNYTVEVEKRDLREYEEAS
jgi:transposase